MRNDGVWMLAVLALVLAACGASGGDAAPTTSGGGPSTDDSPATTATGGTTATQTTTTAGEAPQAPSGGDLDMGTVTIGDMTWEFDATPGAITGCDPNFFGAFRVIGATEEGATVSILLPPEGDENFDDPPSIRVSNAGDADWTADVSILETGNYASVISEGDSQIDSFAVDGTTASGTATFVDENDIFAALGGTADDPEPVRGSFEVTCASE